MAAPTVVCTGRNEAPPGGRSTFSPSACGATFEVRRDDGDPEAGPMTWDVRRYEHGDVLERHTDAVCPYCGNVTFVVEGEDL